MNPTETMLAVSLFALAAIVVVLWACCIAMQREFTKRLEKLENSMSFSSIYGVSHPLTATHIIDRFDELYHHLKVLRLSIPGYTKLVKTDQRDQTKIKKVQPNKRRGKR